MSLSYCPTHSSKKTCKFYTCTFVHADYFQFGVNISTWCLVFQVRLWLGIIRCSTTCTYTYYQTYMDWYACVFCCRNPTPNITRNVSWDPFNMYNLSFLVIDYWSYNWFRYRQNKYGFWNEYFPTIAKQNYCMFSFASKLKS